MNESFPTVTTDTPSVAAFTSCKRLVEVVGEADGKADGKEVGLLEGLSVGAVEGVDVG